MKLKKIDFKIKKTEHPVPKKSKKRIDKPSSMGGFVFILIGFVVITAFLYFILKDMPFGQTESQVVNQNQNPNTNLVPELTHFLLINQKGDQQLISTIMVRFHSYSRQFVLSYFPAELSLNLENTFAQDYLQGGADKLVYQFKNYFQVPFQYLVVKDNFYKQISRLLKNVILFAEDKHNLLFDPSFLEPIPGQTKLHVIQGDNLLQYLHLNEPSASLDSITSKRIRLLYTIMSFLSKSSELIEIFRDQAELNKWFVKSSFSATNANYYLSLISQIKLKDLYTYSFKLKKNGQRFEIIDKLKDYQDFCSNPKKEYPKSAQGIKVKVIDQSGKINKEEDVKKYFEEVLHIQVVDYSINESETRDHSYVINLSHDLEVLNYVKGALDINLFYNSAHLHSHQYDLVVVMGKDFSKITSANKASEATTH